MGGQLDGLIGVGDGGYGARTPLKFGKNIFRAIIM